MSYLPNILTLSRIFVIPFVIYAYSENYFILAGTLALWGGISDFLDGYTARKFKTTSSLGSLLDPVADKFFEMAIILYFLFVGELPFYYVFLLWFRNIAQLLAIPILGWRMKIPFKVKPKWPAKWGSAMGFIIISFVIAHQIVMVHFLNFQWEWVSFVITKIMVPISSGFEIYILVTYLPRFWQIANGTHDTFE